ncbi:MAG: hypothetical protein M3R50_05800 [Bacteroidota bacterium]|nr:hypothetical protein [Bacteroidota bacterium]
MKEIFNKSVPVIVLFVLVNAVILIFKKHLAAMGFELRFLLVANLLLFCLSLAGFFVQMRGLKSSNTNAFIRGIYTSLLLKIFIVVIVLGIYLFISGGNVNKPSLLTAMALYIFYTFIEVKQLIKISRRTPNA